MATMNSPNVLYNIFRQIYFINFPLHLSISKRSRARSAYSLEFERALVITVTEIHLQVTQTRFLACKVTRFASDLLCKYCSKDRTVQTVTIVSTASSMSSRNSRDAIPMMIHIVSANTWRNARRPLASKLNASRTYHYVSKKRMTHNSRLCDRRST